MTALEIYESVFDSANNLDEKPTDHAGWVEYVQAYAYGAFGVFLSDRDAENIVNAAEKWEEYDGGNWSVKYYYMVEEPLDYEIE